MKIRLLSLLFLLALPLGAALPEKTAAPLRVAHGAEIRLADYLVPGKTVIFDFTSAYCPPCRGYDEPLKLLHARRADLVVVQVDINRPGVRKIDWQSPVARQFGLNSIPRFQIYGPDGRLVAADRNSAQAPARRQIDRWIAELTP